MLFRSLLEVRGEIYMPVKEFEAMNKRQAERGERLFVNPSRLKLMTHRPHRQHGDDDGDELQHHAPPHQLLRSVGRTAAHHVDETEQQHDDNGGGGERKQDAGQE